MSDVEVLSQDEVNLLLGAVADEQAGGEPAGGGIAPPAKTAVSKKHDKFKKYDFSRPGIIAKDHTRAMNILHQQFARLFSASLSSMLRALVDVECDTVDQLTYGDFVMSLSDPSCLCKLSMLPLPGTVIMEISPDLVFPIVEKLLGGQGSQNFPKRRMTEIEKVIIEQMTEVILNGLNVVWKQAKDNIEFRLDAIETDPDYVQVVSPNDIVMLVVLSVKFASIQGMVSICFPFNTVERALAEASYDEWQLSSTFTAVKDEEYKPRIQQRVDKANVLVRAVFPKTLMPMDELSGLEVGNVLELDVRVQNKQIVDPIVVEVANKPRFFGRLGRFRKNVAVKVTGLIEDEES